MLKYSSKIKVRNGLQTSLTCNSWTSAGSATIPLSFHKLLGSIVSSHTGLNMLSPTTHRFSTLTAVLSTVRMESQVQKGCQDIKSYHVWSHCFPFVYMKKRRILDSLSYRHKLTSFGHLQVNQASADTKQGA